MENRIKELLAQKGTLSLHINEQVEILEYYIFERKNVKIKIEIPDLTYSFPIMIQNPRNGNRMITTEIKLMDYMFNQCLKYYSDKFNNQ